MMDNAARQETNSLAQSIRGADIVARRWSIADSYDYCERLARSHYENFPVGSILVPRHLRKHFYSIYAYARTADDFADEGYNETHTEQERLKLLQEWRGMLLDAYGGKAGHPIFIALAETVSQFDLPVALFEDLLSAFEQDVTTRRYRAFDDLLGYCRRSANPIGRLLLLLFGHRDEQMHGWSDCICTALQLANHWQDVAIDMAKDRIYLPAEDMAEFGVSESSIAKNQATAAFRQLMQYEIGRARALFARGKPLCLAAGGRLGLELRVVWLGGSRILDRIEHNGYDVFSNRPAITKRDKIEIFTLALRKEAFRRY